jgi:hypothetical protein
MAVGRLPAASQGEEGACECLGWSSATLWRLVFCSWPTRRLPQLRRRISSSSGYNRDLRLYDTAAGRDVFSTFTPEEEAFAGQWGDHVAYASIEMGYADLYDAHAYVFG